MLLQKLDQPIPVELPEGRSYEIVFDGLHSLPEHMRDVDLRPGKCLVVTDRNVAGHYRGKIDSILKEDGWDPLILVLPPGETTKSTRHLEAIYNAALAWNVDRTTPVIALGGGVIGDVAGFAAATLLRGLPLIQVPTSLIAQVDSSIGGKTGINHEEGKNLIGAFHQPRLVLSDSKLLFTLDRREWLGGLAEAFKHAVIADETYFAWIESELPRILSRDPKVVGDLVYRAASIKAKIVSRDERETGGRVMLNFGHTFGHALERETGYGTYSHGEAVLIGMKAALFLSRRFNRKVEMGRIEGLLSNIPLPPVPSNLGVPSLRLAMSADKKRDSERIRFVLIRRLGQAYTTFDVSVPDMDDAWAHALGRP